MYDVGPQTSEFLAEITLPFRLVLAHHAKGEGFLSARLRT
jgi:hypothetical protein